MPITKAQLEKQYPHMSARQIDRLHAEMTAGQRRQAEHQETRERLDRQGVNLAQREDSEVTADGVMARMAADRKIAEAKAAEDIEAALRANTEKAVLDHNEAYNGHSPAVLDHVSDEATRLLEQRAEQAGGVGMGAFSVPGPQHAEAAQANAEKEVLDRVESLNNRGDAVFQGVTGPVTSTEDGNRYDDDGNLIENDQQAGAHEPQPPTGQAIHEEQAAADAEANATANKKARRGRPVSPANAVGDGPKSE